MSEIIVPKYNIDLDSLVKIFRDEGVYTKKHFKTLWENLSDLCNKGVVISHIEVFKEIKDGHKDELYHWAKTNKHIFKDYNLPEEALKIQEIGKKFPFFVHQKKEKTAHADPWLVAQAMINDIAVITEESKTGGQKTPKVCSEFNVECLSLIELIRKNNWIF